MSDIPFAEDRTINILSAYWRLWHDKSPDLVTPAPSIVELISGCKVGKVFFMQVYHDLRSGSSGKYANFTQLDFENFLVTEYRRPVQFSEEDQALYLPDEPVELGPKREPYRNVCWRCGSHISSVTLSRCSNCRWFICGDCGSCKRGCTRTYTPFVINGADGPFLPDFPDDDF